MNLKNTFKTVFATVIFMLSGSLVYSQIIGPDAYMIGDYIEIGINGAGGHEGAEDLPTSHNRSNLSISSPVYFGFVANPQLDSWATYDGDFFSPGTPENGSGMEISGVNYGNNAAGGPLNEIPGGLVGYEEIGDCINVEWEGTAGGVTMNVKYHLLKSNLFYTTEITLTNDTGTDLTDVYYYRNVDPDNNVSIGGGYGTTNTIVSQSDSTCQKSLVSAEQDRPADAGPGTSYVGFGALGENFSVSRGGFFNRDGSDIWNGTAPLIGTVGSSAFADQAISIAYKSDIPAGGSINFTYAVVLSADALEAAFEGLYYIHFESVGVVGGGIVSECSPSVDTAQTCGGNPVYLTVNGPNVEDFDWVWSPADGLSETIGTETTATPSETTTYIVTGTPIGGCLEEPIVKTIVVEYLDGPLIEITDPGVICGPFDLTTLVFEDANDVAGTVTHFFSEIPDSASQVEPLWPSDFMVEGDSVYLMIGDTVNGCFDWQLIEIEFGAPGNAGSDSLIVYCGGEAGLLDLNALVSDDADEDGVFGEVGGIGVLDEETGIADLTDLPAGSYQFSYTVGEAPCPIDIAIYTVIIYPTLEVAISGTDASCGVDDGTATAIVTGGTAPYSYLWSTGETTETITGLAAGTYYVTVTDAIGCTQIVTIEIEGTESTMEIDKLSKHNVTCHGGSDGSIYVIMEGGTAPYTYLWSTGDTGLGISGLEAGIYTLVVTDALGCTFTEVFIIGEPDAIDVTITVDGLVLTSNEDDAYYQWVICPDFEPIDGATDQSYTVPYDCGDTEYAVIITNKDGCVDTSECVSPGDGEGAVGISADNLLEFSIYPNPTTGNVYVRLAGVNTGIELSVIDLKGSVIFEKTVSSSTTLINLSGVSNGIYFIQIKSEDAIMTKKIIVNK